jgi:hypothetical protein
MIEVCDSNEIVEMIAEMTVVEGMIIETATIETPVMLLESIAEMTEEMIVVMTEGMIVVMTEGMIVGTIVEMTEGVVTETIVTPKEMTDGVITITKAMIEEVVLVMIVLTGKRYSKSFLLLIGPERRTLMAVIHLPLLLRKFNLLPQNASVRFLQLKGCPTMTDIFKNKKPNASAVSKQRIKLCENKIELHMTSRKCI